MENSSFIYNIGYYDSLRIWPILWDMLKDQLNLHYISIIYKNYTFSKSLQDLNIKMCLQDTNSDLKLYIIKLNSTNEINKAFKETFTNNVSKLNIEDMVIVVMDIENSESSVKNSLKLFEKIKNELKYPNLKLLPTNPEFNKVSDIVNEFFKEFKLKIQTQINFKIDEHIKFLNDVKYIKLESLENSLNYINIKDKMIRILTLCKFWNELIDLCEEDLKASFINLKVETSKFVNPFCLIDYNDSHIKSKIFEKTITNLDYKQYLIITICKACESNRDYKKLNQIIGDFLSGIVNFKRDFICNYYYVFFCYLLTLQYITLLRFLKVNTKTKEEEDINIAGQLNVFYHTKRFIKNFSILINAEIPSLKNLKSYLSNDDKEDSSVVLTDNNDLLTSLFIEVNSNIDKKTSLIIQNRQNLIKEYLNILLQIEKLHSALNQKKLTLRIYIEEIPILIYMKELTSIKSKLKLILDSTKNEGWNSIYELLNYILILVINKSDKSNNNLELMIDYLNYEFKNVQSLNTFFNGNLENVRSLLSDYFNQQNFNQLDSKPTIDINKLFDIKITYPDFKDYQNHLHNFLNVNEHKTLKLNLFIVNKSKVDFNIKNIVFSFIDSNSKNTFDKDFSSENIKDLLVNQEKEQTFKIETELFSRKSLIHLNYLLFVLANGLKCIFRFESEEACKFSINDNNIKANTKILNHFSSFYFNTVYTWEIELLNMNEIKDKSEFIISIIDKYPQNSVVKIFKENIQIKNIQEDQISNQFEFDIVENQIIFNDTNKFKEERYYILIDFICENSEYLTSEMHQIEVTNIIYSKNKDINDKKDIFFILKNTQFVTFKHIFTLTHKLKLVKDYILLQTAIKLNLENNFHNVKILVSNNNSEEQNEHSCEVNTITPINLIRVIENKRKSQTLSLDDIYFIYTYTDNCLLTYYYPDKSLIDPLANLLDVPYHIKTVFMNLDNRLNQFKLFEEILLKIEIKKYFKDPVLFLIKVKENDNFTIVGKNKIIVKLINDNDQESTSIQVNIKLIPLKDGYYKLPKIDFMHYKIIDNASLSKISKDSVENNFNSLEFLPIYDNSLIEGVEKIIRIVSGEHKFPKLNFI